MASYGPRWQGSSHPQNTAPPFPGAPPIPAGVNIPPTHWNAGTWIPNPHYNPQAARPSAPAWLPANAWGFFPQPHQFRPQQQQQQQQQQQPYNPYKRQPRAPSAEYLATKLSDNPLGLTNMIPAEELERKAQEVRERERQQNEAANSGTPWLWNPQTLEDDDEDDGTPERPPSQAPESFTSKGVLQPTFSINIIRTPDHYIQHRASVPTQIYAPRRTSLDAVTTQLANSSLTRHNSLPTTLLADHLTDEPVSITDVLSPLVIPMTPKPTRHPPVPTPSASLDTIPESATSSSPQSQPQSQSPHYSHSRSRPSSRQASRSGSSSASPYSLPHSGQPSPISPTYPHSSGHSPNQPHFPNSKNPLPPPPAQVPFPTSPGSSYIYKQPTSTSHSRTKSYSSHPQTGGTAIFHSSNGSSTVQLTSSPPRSPPPTHDRPFSPPHYHHHYQAQVPDRSSTTTPTTSKPKRSSSHPSITSKSPSPSSTANNTSSSSSSSSPNNPNKSNLRRRRRGFWNRRGDHVTQAGYIVYSPPDKVYPQDLDDYPDGKDGGYRNEHGMKTQWVHRPDLIPEAGYDSLIEWVYV